MSKSFNSFEEISTIHPLDHKSNCKFMAYESYEFILTLDDMKLARERHPYGWWSSIDSKWFYWDIGCVVWYDRYFYDGDRWYLGLETWDGIVQAEEPSWGIRRAYNIHKTEIGIFKTLEEAEEYRNKKLKERLEF